MSNEFMFSYIYFLAHLTQSIYIHVQCNWNNFDFWILTKINQLIISWREIILYNILKEYFERQNQLFAVLIISLCMLWSNDYLDENVCCMMTIVCLFLKILAFNGQFIDFFDLNGHNRIASTNSKDNFMWHWI